jgi:cysteine desulfurase
MLQETLDREDAGAVVMMAANNETGACFPWREVASLCRARGIPFFCDASQWVGKMPIADLNLVDGFAASAHKWGGPKGVGVLRFRRAFPFLRGLVGGGQEQGLRASTEDVASVVAMVEALTARQNLWSCGDHREKRSSMREGWIKKLEQALPEVVVHARNQKCLWNTISVAMPHTRADQWVLELERFGHVVGTGSACSAAAGKASRILADLGVSEDQRSRTLRISSGWDTY